jgi:hypothetical protein
LGEGLGLGFNHRAREPRLGIVLDLSEAIEYGQSRLALVHPVELAAEADKTESAAAAQL